MVRRAGFILSLCAVFALAPYRGHAADDREYKEAVKHVRKGQEYLTTERFDEAEKEFLEAISLDPLIVGGPYGLGQTYMAKKQYPDAVEAYVAAEKAFHEQQAEALTDRLAYQKKLDDQIKALRDDNNTARRQVSGPGAEGMQRAISRNEEQIRTLEGLKNRDVNQPQPTPHWLSLALGSAYFRNQDLANAQKSWRAAVEVKPDLGEAHLNLAVVCMLTGRLDEAEEEVALAEKAGLKVPQGLKDDIAKRKAGGGA